MRSVKKHILIIAASLLLTSATMSAAEETATAVDNPVKAEMRLLNQAFLNLIDSIILNNPKAIEEPFHAVHEAGLNTEKALKDGKIKLPKNNDRMKEFVEQDKQFHKKMEVLIQASGKSDMKKVQEITHQLLNGCIKCHVKFRN